MKDPLGDRMKMYEKIETSRRLLPLAPIYARIDGRKFSKFTAGMEKPYDRAMAQIMRQTTQILMERTHARIAYHQSDEINLVWIPRDDHDITQFFEGRTHKLTSILSALATSAFMEFLSQSHHRDRMSRFPHFDCRVMSLPNESEAVNALLWRHSDARRNAILGLAQKEFGHKKIQGVGTPELTGMLAEKGIRLDQFNHSFISGRFFIRKRNIQGRNMVVDHFVTTTENRWAAINELMQLSVEDKGF